MKTLRLNSRNAQSIGMRNLRSRAKQAAGLIFVLVGLIYLITLPAYSSVRLATYGDDSRDSTSGARQVTAISTSASIFTWSEPGIDPVLVYSTTGIGGRVIAADSFGNAYVGNGGTIMKLNSKGTSLVYSTFLGDGTALAIAVDAAGNAYVTGSTSAPSFPTTPGVVQTTYGGNGDAFVAKLDAYGVVKYSTFLGGSHNDEGRAIAVDSVGNAYVMGLTDLPSTTPDAFVTTLNETGSAISSSYHIAVADRWGGFAVDASGNAYMTGSGSSFPVTPGAFSTGGYIFISKINALGVVYSAQFGDSRWVGPLTPDEIEGAYSVAVDSAGNAYVTGYVATAYGSVYISPGAFQSKPQSDRTLYDHFLMKVNATGNSLVYSTYLNSGTHASPIITPDSGGNVYWTGGTWWPNFPTTSDAFQTKYGGGGSDAFVAKLNPTGTALLFSTYLGGSGGDQGAIIAADAAGNAYVVGTTDSSDFPTTPGAFQPASGGHFIAKINTVDTSSAIPVASVSAASFQGQEVAQESIIAGFGANLATSVAVADTVPLPTRLAGTTFKVKDSLGTERLAPLFFVSPAQVNFALPAGTAQGTAMVTSTNGNGTMSTGNVMIVAVAPGLFAANSNGQGVAAALVLRVKADGTQVFEQVAVFDAGANRFIEAPIDLGPPEEQVFLVLFGTGMRFRSSLSAAQLAVGGTALEVLFLGGQGGFVGLDQLNSRLPRSLVGRGSVNVVLVVDGKPANVVTINIR